MPVTLSVRKVPAALVERLRQRAANHHRSLQDELLAILDAAAPPGITINELARRAKALRAEDAGGIGGHHPRDARRRP
jgi:plasmid stability protein